MSYNYLVDPRSVYIHWPFCPYKCHFCPFVALASQDQFMPRYHNALVTEITRYKELTNKKISIDTLFFGGGTPSTYPDDLLLDMFGILNKTFSFESGAEISIEVNPGTIRKEQLLLWKELGINRLSLGVQSLKDQVLKKLNRHQSAQQVYQALESASGIFDNISVDFILGLPEVTPEQWRELIEEAVNWPIMHISIYFLMVHEDTPLYFGVKKKAITLPCDEIIVDLYYWTIDYLAQHGFEQYEISNFARAGYQSRHNSAYWQRKPYKAFGLGACEFDGQQRMQNEKNLMKYLQGIESGADVTVFCEKLTEDQIYLERVMLGLRQNVGISYDELLQGLTDTQKQLLQERVALLQESDFVTWTNDRLRLTPKGLAVENDIVVKLSL